MLKRISGSNYKVGAGQGSGRLIRLGQNQPSGRLGISLGTGLGLLLRTQTLDDPRGAAVRDQRD